ncbi:hypothetical protein BH24CHL8_BH24CHL8_04440 [soil metagenome]
MADESEPTLLDRHAAQRELTRVADDVLPALIARFDAGRLGELEVRHGDWRVRLRRANGAAGQAAEGAAGRGAAGAGRSRDHRESRDPREPREARESREASGEVGRSSRDGGGARADRLPVASPAVGYFQPVEGLEVGRSFRTGDVLGHIDVLGIRHDVVAPADGVLGRVHAEPGEAVEYGQEIARVDLVPSRPTPESGPEPDPATEAA